MYIDKQKSNTIKKTLPILSVLIPLGVYGILSFILKDWIIDDAGISFAYARNLANSDGLTAWPGTKPIEGYSNFLWVLLFAVLHLLSLFDPIMTPKILGVIFTASSLVIVLKICKALQVHTWYVLLINLLLVANAPLLIWSNSGLENAMYLTLFLWLILLSIKTSVSPNTRNLIGVTTLSLLLILTRPEGLIYVAVFPLVMLTSQSSFKLKFKTISIYVLPLILLTGIYLWWKWSYYGSIIPNPYFAKKESYFHQLINHQQPLKALFEKFNYLSFGIGGRWAIVLLGLLNLLLPVQFLFSQRERKYDVLIFAFLLSELAFFILPNDWMGELRFATLFIVTSYLVIAIVLKTLLDKYTVPKWLIVGLLVLFGSYHYFHFVNRTIDFKANKVASFLTVKEFYTDRFNHYAYILKLPDASILLPDVGAMYYYSNIRVYDAAGLCDPVIARNIHTNREQLQYYLFNELKPTFISLHGRWAYLYQLDSNPQFREDYMPISEGPDLHVKKHFHMDMVSGNYIRKEAITIQNQEVFNSLSDNHNAFDE